MFSLFPRLFKKSLSTQIETVLPRSNWESVKIIENNEPLVLLSETDKLVFYKDNSLSNNIDYRVRKTVADMLHNTANSLPKEYKLAVIEGVRTISRQKSLWEIKNKELKNMHPDWSQEKIEHESRLVLSKPSPLANHNCGGAVDVTLVYADNSLVDMGTLPQSTKEDKKIRMFSKLLTKDQNFNRKVLREMMEKNGFVWYPGEWWHYCYGDRMWAVYTKQTTCYYGPIQMIKQY